jgi:uncharacterized membrane protein
MSTGNAAAEAVSVTRRVPRWMWTLLILSLALNLLIAGIVMGSMWAVRRGGYWDAPMFFERTHRFMRGLPSERRAEIRRLSAEYRPQLRPHWRGVREARIAIGRLIEGEYTPPELDAALSELYDKEAKAREAARPMIAAMLKALRPEERRHFLAVYMPYLSEMQGRPEPRGELP